ncbi:EAL domain-containing protein [Pokkaliibacter sp. CJK22405]|uniref:EAL domain-containing response regulator n=1 Tax=Pokkaliibacter sp. CJK22405 TaxID=3384615 RepID=UPI0039848969
MKRVLVVDDELNNVNAIVRLLRRRGYEGIPCTDPHQAISLIQRHHIRVVLSDQRMPGMQGSELMHEIKKYDPEILCILISAYTDFSGLTEAINSGVLFKFIPKPWKREELLGVLEDAFSWIDQQRLRRMGQSAYVQSDDAMLILNHRWQVQSANAGYLEARQIELEDVIGRTLFEVEPSLDQHLIEHSVAERGQWSADHWLSQPDGELRCFALSLRSVEDQGGEPFFYTLRLRDQTLQQRVETQLRTDLLTGLNNRQAFVASAEAANKGDSQAVLVLDIVNFRHINQSLGHTVADQLLVFLGERLKSLLAKEQGLGRIGTDHFSVYFPSITNVDDLRSTVDHWLETLRGPYDLSGGELFIALRGGLSFGETRSPVELIQEAETALSYAKQYEAGPLIMFDSGLMHGARERLRLWSDLHRALEREEFELLFQPKVSAHDGRWVGAEALLRWYHPVLGEVQPDIFVTLAEESGLIMSIGRWVIHRALDALKQWREETGSNDLHVAVNISPTQLADEGLVQAIGFALSERGLQADALQVEITESQLLDPLRATSIIAELSMLGVKVVLDDFGTGYASFECLGNYEFSTVKLDKSFVDGIEKRPRSRVLVHAMIEMAHALSMVVVAEGVERDSQWRYLKEMDCDQLQGYRFSRALPASKMVEWAANAPQLADE